MPSVLTDHDKQTVKRIVPKASNKIQAVAVARLYVVPPGRNRWTYTGLQGAAVLSNDLIGNTFWIKLVDISPANRGVIWDQEIYDSFQYNQDRTFFHSFELEECMAALSFVDEKEARQFKKKMDERENNASKDTRKTPFGMSAGGAQLPQQVLVNEPSKSHSRLGGLFSRHRNTSNPQQLMPAVQQQPQPPPQPVYASIPVGMGGSRPQSNAGIDLDDPQWAPMLDQLVAQGIRRDQIAENKDFIVEYLRQKQAESLAQGLASNLNGDHGRVPPPPPPPPPASSAARSSTDDMGSSSRRGPPPAPPPSRRPVPGSAPSPPAARGSSPMPRTPSPPSTPQPRFRAPPPLADAGKFAVADGPESAAVSGRPRAHSNLMNPGPAPPPRPPKEPEEDQGVHRAPPPFAGQRQSSAPLPPPSRGALPPPPPSRNSGAVPPPPPPSRANAAPVAPLLPPTNARAPSAPPLPPSINNNYIPPPPPPMPGLSSNIGSGGPPPPPPPLPPSSSSAAAPPPPPPPPSSSVAMPLPKSTGGGRDDLLAAIRAGGGSGLRKVKDTEKRDRSAVVVPGSDAATSAATPSAPAPGADSAGLAGALQAALQKRKQKVSGSGTYSYIALFFFLFYKYQMLTRCSDR